MPAGVCSQREHSIMLRGRERGWPHAEHASPCSDVTHDATLIFWSRRSLSLSRFFVPPISGGLSTARYARSRRRSSALELPLDTCRSAVGIGKHPKNIWPESVFCANEGTNGWNRYVMFYKYIIGIIEKDRLSFLIIYSNVSLLICDQYQYQIYHNAIRINVPKF